MVAAMTLKFLDPFGSGKLVLFQVTYDKVRICAPYMAFSVNIPTGLACV